MGQIDSNTMKDVKGLMDVNFAESVDATLTKTKLDSFDRTQFQKKLLKIKEKEIELSTKIHCRQCGTKEKKYFSITVRTPTMNHKDATFTCSCTNCGFGSKRDIATRKKITWNITNKQQEQK